MIGSGTIQELVLVAAILLLAETLRTRRAWMGEVEQRLGRSAAEREREAERGVERERLRIAHELHDVLAHTVALIGVQAGVASEALEDSPAEARAALRTIREKTREALTELKATVGVLREPRDERSSRRRRGWRSCRSSWRLPGGRALQVDVSGVRRRSNTPPRWSIWRRIGSSRSRSPTSSDMPTPVTRHSRLATSGDAVVIQVDDDGRGSTNGRAAVSEGYGLVGMRERAAAVGGRLEAGPALSPGRGFRVRAWLPTNGVRDEHPRPAR